MIMTLLSQFSATQACKPKGFFGLDPWYKYLDTDKDCNIINFNVLPTNGQSDLLLIGVAVVDDLLRVAGLVAIAFVIYGGIQYVASQGSPDQTQKAQSTIQNALVGLIICMLAVAVVSFLGSKLG
jgi:hypothetical protein